MKALATTFFMGAATAILLLPPLRVSAATETVVYSFCSQQYCEDGEYPWAGVLRVKGQLYTTTTLGGGNGSNAGTLIAVNRKTGAKKFVYSFANYSGDGGSPKANGLIDVDGTLYGMTGGGGSVGAGTLYALDPKLGIERVLYSFCSNQKCKDGALPFASLLAADGKLYGTTVVGGGGVTSCFGPYPGCGTVFAFDPVKGTERVLYTFCQLESCADGSKPTGDLIEVNGILYGTASAGGPGSGCSDMGLGCGVVFALDPATGIETALHTFAGELDGGVPRGGLVDVNGILYGSTEFGGSYSGCGYGDGCGTVFSVDPSTGAETILHAFQNDGKDGRNPLGNLIEVKGKLYGTTQSGGAYGGGTVYSVNLETGKEKVIYSFCSLQNCADGGSPYAGLIDVGGTLYGTTVGGGTGNPYTGGTIFSITP